MVIGAQKKQATYAIDGDRKLVFVIITDPPAEGLSFSVGSSWDGQLAGSGVPYDGDSDGLAIAGTDYAFADGRLFVVLSSEAGISVKQLAVPIGTATYKAELERIAKLEALQEALSQ